MGVFQSLMATRAVRVSAMHVQALNSIDIEFGGGVWLGTPHPTRAERNVIEAWKNYQDHLNDASADAAMWASRQGDLFVELLYQMSRSLGYSFDKVQLRKGVYSPVAHSRLEQDAETIRKSLIEIMSGQRPLPIQLLPRMSETDQQIQDRAAIGLSELLDGQRPLRVKIESDENQSR